MASNDDIRVILNGTELTFDVMPQLIDGRTLVPMRRIFESMGAEVDWNGDTQTVTATQDDNIIIMQIDNPVISVNGVDTELDVPPQLIDGRTLVPVRAVAEGLNADVEWDGDARAVIITGSDEEPTITGQEQDTAEPSSELVQETRYIFEQLWLPEVLFEYYDEFTFFITNVSIDALDNILRYEWYFATGSVLMAYFLYNDIPFSLDALERARTEYGLGQEHIISISLEQIDANITAIIIEMLPMPEQLISTFIGIAYSTESGLRYFTLERSIDFFGDGNPTYV